MAGRDEEPILIVLDDSPDRTVGNRNQGSADPQSTNSRRKRSEQRRRRRRGPPVPVSVPIIILDEEGEEDGEANKANPEASASGAKKTGGDESMHSSISDASRSNSVLPCMEKLREELSCGICLEICFEPSTTACGHSFCMKCLRSAADKCGKKCPKCRQLISNGSSCTVNTVLWNTIQLLFPREVEERKAAGALNNHEMEPQMREANGRRRETPDQDQDAALALRLQRQEFMGSFRGNNQQSSSGSSTYYSEEEEEEEEEEEAEAEAEAAGALNDHEMERQIPEIRIDTDDGRIGIYESLRRLRLLDQDWDPPLSEGLSRRATIGSRTRTLEQVEDLTLE